MFYCTVFVRVRPPASVASVLLGLGGLVGSLLGLLTLLWTCTVQNECYMKQVDIRKKIVVSMRIMMFVFRPARSIVSLMVSRLNRAANPTIGPRVIEEALPNGLLMALLMTAVLRSVAFPVRRLILMTPPVPL